MELYKINYIESIACLSIDTNEDNSFHLEAFEAFDKILDQFYLDYEAGKITALIIRSNRPNVFSQGLNLAELSKKDPQTHRKELEAFIGYFYSILKKIHFFPAPVICEINAHCMGYGCMIAIVSDFRVMVDKGARIGLPEVKIGIRVPIFIAHVLQGIIGAQEANKHMLLGMPYKSEVALEIGFVDECFEIEKLESEALKLAKKFSSCSKTGTATSKAAMRYTLFSQIEKIIKIDYEETLKIIETPDAKEGVSAAVAGRRPRFNS